MKKIIILILILPFALVFVLPGIQKELKLIKVAPLKSVFYPANKMPLTGKTWFSGDFQLCFENYLKDHLGLRPVFVRIYNQYNFSILGLPSYGDVQIGKNNVLYQPIYLQAYKGKDFAGSTRIDSFIYRMKVVQDELEHRQKYFLFIIAPGKVNVYPEIVPDKIGLIKVDTTNYEVMVDRLNKYNVNYIDFCNYFITIKDTIQYPLFTRYGTHWSGSAVSMVMDSILKRIEVAIREKIINYEHTEGYVTDKDLKFTDADLAQYMDLIVPLKPDPVYYPVYNFDTASTRSHEILIVGDSFCQSFWGFDNVFPRVFSDSSMFWAYYRYKEWPVNKSLSMPINTLYLEEYICNLDIILLESVDANLNLLGYSFIDDLFCLFTQPGNSKERLAARLRENIIYSARMNNDQYLVQQMAVEMQITVDSAYQVLAYQRQKEFFETKKILY
ncbi:MAG: hypothetical protein JW973_07000 [Bacteroidales bacterium]|nr:hypothetical protein [Bacteroidales bacterium]